MTSSTESFWSEIKGYEERLKKNPASYCFAPLVDVYLRAGLLEDALSVARAGVIRYPGFVAGQMALARVCHQKGLVDECRVALEVVTGAVPEHPEAQKMLSRLYTESGRGQEACRALQTLLEFCPDDITAKLELESMQRRFAIDPSDDDLELIEFTEADIYEELEYEDQLVERVKPVAAVIEDPWAGVSVLPEPVAEPALEPEPMLVSVPEPVTEVMPTFEQLTTPVPESEPAFVPMSEPVPEAVPAFEPLTASVAESEVPAVQVLPDLDSVWSMPEQQLESPVEAAEEDPLITPTMAELYVSQGFPDKAIAIYRKIVDADALNQDAVARLAELEHSADAADAAQSAVAAAEQAPAQISLPVEGAADQQAKISVLEGWLENIRRLRVCR